MSSSTPQLPAGATPATLRSSLLALFAPTAAEAADQLSVPVVLVEAQYADPEFRRDAISAVLGTIGGHTPLSERLREIADRARTKLDDLLVNDKTPAGVRAKVAMTLLDRVPDSQTGQKFEHTFKLDAETIALIERTKLESTLPCWKRSVRRVIEAHAEEVEYDSHDCSAVSRGALPEFVNK